MNNVGSAVQHLENDGEVEEYFELIREIWGEQSGLDALARKLIAHHPGMTLKNIYVIRDGGRMVSTVNLIPVKWSIGGTLLKIAQMGFVGTLLTYRGKGLIRSLVEEYHKDVAKGGYDLSVLEGIPYFYRQFGYDYVIPFLEETWIRLDKVPDFKSKIQVRPFTDKDVFLAMQLLKEAQRKYYVHSLRDKTVWLNQHRTSIASDPEPFTAFAVEEEGNVVAYFRMREVKKENRLILIEISQVDELVAQEVLSFLKNSGLRLGLETLSINVSCEEPLAEYVVALGGESKISLRTRGKCG